MAMVKTIEHGIQYALDNPGPDTHRQLLCYAALDMSPGHVLRDRREQPQWYSQRAQAAVAEVMPAAGTSAIVDTTTLVNAFCVLNDREPVESLPPGALFDVATFISACVFEDHVLFLSNRRVSSRDVASLLPGSSVRELPWGNESDFALIVENAWGEAERYAPPLFNHPNWKDKFVEHWSGLVGATLDPAAAAWPANYRRYFSSVDSLAVERAIIGHDPGDDHLTTVLDLMEGFVTESSVRTVFFSLLANAIGATYYASAFRTRLREIVYEETGHSVLSDSQAIVAHLNETFRLDLGKDDFIANDVPVPFVLSAALAGVSTCAGLCENIVKLRDIAAPLRAKRAELARAWSNQDQSSVHALIKAVTDDARHLADTEYFAGHGLIARWILSPGGARPALGALGRLLVSFAPLPDDVKAVLRNRSVRPELWAVSRLSAQARRVINCVDPMYELLRPKGLKPSTQDRDRHLRVLRRLAA